VKLREKNFHVEKVAKFLIKVKIRKLSKKKGEAIVLLSAKKAPPMIPTSDILGSAKMRLITLLF